MPVTSARILDAQSTQLAATIDGVEWSGNRCHLENGVLVIDGDGQIPDAVKAWLAAGGVPTPYNAPAPTVPASAPRWRIRMALLTRGLLDQADALATAAGGATRILWFDNDTIERHHPAIPGFAAALGLTTDESIDEVFRDADTY